MVDTSQSTRSARLSLAHQRRRERPVNAELGTWNAEGQRARKPPRKQDETLMEAQDRFTTKESRTRKVYGCGARNSERGLKGLYPTQRDPVLSTSAVLFVLFVVSPALS